MDVGMMWFDPDPRSGYGDKIQKAAAYYRGKYGRAPTLCYVHPATAGSPAPSPVNGVEVRTSRSVLPHHYWLGVAKANGGSSQA
jgi:hypothetical protein